MAHAAQGAGPLTNARDDHLLNGRLWRSALQASRCLVVVDGYYEWLAKRPRERYARPIRYTLGEGVLFAFAGLFTWHPEVGEAELLACLQPYDAAAMLAHEVTPFVGEGGGEVVGSLP